jgi:hypothetical protein
MSERGGVACIRAPGGRTAEIESRLLRPVIRGETTRPWQAQPTHERIVWPYDTRGRLRDPLPPRARRWFARFRRRLQARSDARDPQRWWMLFRTEGAIANEPRVVWADFGRRPRALVLPAGDPTIPLNTCYVVHAPCDGDAAALAAILNSDVAAAWLHAIAEPARGGFHRYLGWTMSRLPLPADWERARAILAPLVEQHAAGGVAATRWTEAVLDAYGLRRRDVAALLTWAAA